MPARPSPFALEAAREIGFARKTVAPATTLDSGPVFGYNSYAGRVACSSGGKRATWRPVTYLVFTPGESAFDRFATPPRRIVSPVQGVGRK